MNHQVFNIIDRVEQIADQIKGDTGGGCPTAKSVLLSFLTHRMSLQTYVEIGVYRGRGLLPIAAAIQQNGGTAYGIDPFSNEEFKENDIPEDIKDVVQNFWGDVGLANIYQDVLRCIDEFSLSDTVRILKMPSHEAADKIKMQLGTIDLLHIDGNHDEEMVGHDIEDYLPLVSPKGVVVLDDIDWPGVAKNYEKLISSGIYEVFFEDTYFSVMIQKQYAQDNSAELHRLKREAVALYEREKRYEINAIVQKEQGSNAIPRPVVAVGITAYKHEKYIEKCLRSVLAQRGSFDLHVIIAEDCSGDNTANIIRSVLEDSLNSNITVHFIENEKNLGLISNLKQVFQNLGPCDYFTFCEGDDYWTDKYKIQKHINFLSSHHNCAMSFDRLNLLWQAEQRFEEYAPQLEMAAKGRMILSAYELADDNIIGTLSCSFYSGKYLEAIDYSIFTDELSDWIFNLYFSFNFGDIGMVNEPLTVYRKHDQSSWTGMRETQRCMVLADVLDYYNTYFDFEFDESFEKVKNQCAKEYQYAEEEPMRKCDLLIIDDVFPNTASGFRMEEFSQYLSQIPNMLILNNGPACGVLGAGKTVDTIREYKLKCPDYASKLATLDATVHVKANLAYFVFINNAYDNIAYIEENKIPFIIETYTAGGFALDQPESDAKLIRICSSPCFVKIITTQKRARDYLLMKGFCRPEQIVHIFGVVNPALTKVASQAQPIIHYGEEKKTLDICFVAFRYTKTGEDKGYDIFIETAKILCKKYQNIVFHVVGNFDETVIDVTEIGSNIIFYGKLSSTELQKFFSDKDIILSPNISGKITEGAFDSFPTGGCTEAALSEVSIFTTDEFGENQGKFEPDREIVIIEHDSTKIAEVIEKYYRDPEKLKMLGVQGAKKVRELYSYENQMEPRLRLINEEIAISKAGRQILVPLTPPNRATVLIEKMSKNIFARRIARGLKRILPSGIKNQLKKVYRKICGRYA